MPGIVRVEMADPRGRGRRIPIWLYRPARFTPEGRIVIVMHGLRRDASAYCEAWAPEAERHGLLVAAPEFAEEYYPGVHEYNYGDVLSGDGHPQPRSQWLFPIIDPIFDFIRHAAGAERQTFCLYGHSAGGQFVHRLVSLAWSPRIELAISANAGSYSLPRFDVDYPFGLGGTGLPPSALPGLLARPLVVLVGDRDNDPDHCNLPRHSEAMRQGPHRFARGRYYVDAARQAAAAAGVALRWRLAVAPGVGHSNAGMAPFAARLCAEFQIESPQG